MAVLTVSYSVGDKWKLQSRLKYNRVFKTKLLAVV